MMDPQRIPSSAIANAAPLRLEVISLTGTPWSGDVHEVSLPGSAGRFGVMARHAPLLATLREGMLLIHPVQGQPLELYVSGGCVEVQPDAVTVLADLAVRGDDLDRARAQAARDAATSPMAAGFTDADYASLHLDLIQRYRGRPPR